MRPVVPAWVTGGVFGIAASGILVATGLRMEGRARVAAISVGALGLVLSVGWLVLAAYADAVVE